jgi:oligogalacturonide transporter
MSEIERFKSRAGTEPTAANRRIVEDLSGWPYEKLWGRGASNKT